jgi:hypothetical protein
VHEVGDLVDDDVLQGWGGGPHEPRVDTDHPVPPARTPSLLRVGDAVPGREGDPEPFE